MAECCNFRKPVCLVAALDGRGLALCCRQRTTLLCANLACCPLQSFLRMKADAAWHALEGKVAGKDAEYKDVKVTALVAVQPATVCPEGAHPTCMLPAEVRRGGARGLDVALPLLSALLPAEPKLPLDKHTLYCLLPPTLPFNPDPNLAGLQFGSGGPMLVVGTLDVNQGTRLPAEELMGRLPEEGDKRRRRAYISNVATWAGARRQGVARRMLQEAMREAAAAGVHHLYGER